MLGRTDLPLDEVGRAQAASLAGVIGPVDAVWSSPLLRARQTAESLGAVAIEPDLTEMHQGALDGLDEATLVARFGPLLAQWRADPENLRLPGGETMGEVRDRGVAALERIAAAHPRGRIAIVTHQLTLAATLCTLAGEPLSNWRSYTHPNTAWAEVRWRPDRGIVALKMGPHLTHPPTP